MKNCPGRSGRKEKPVTIPMTGWYVGYEDLAGTDPETVYLCGSKYPGSSGDFSGNPALYVIKDPGTEKYGIYDATDGIWHDYQLDAVSVVIDGGDMDGEEKRIRVEKDFGL